MLKMYLSRCCVRFILLKIILGRFSDSQLDVGWFIPGPDFTSLARSLARDASEHLGANSVSQTLIEALMLDGAAHNGSQHLPPHQIHLGDWTGAVKNNNN